MNEYIILSFHSCLLAALFILALYDINCRMIPNMFLLLFIPIAAGYLCLQYWSGEPLLWVLLTSLFGFLAGGLAMLVPALISKGGIGGADIKLAALLGIIQGPAGILFTLLGATVLAMLVAAVLKLTKNQQKNSVPFVPFLFLGTAALIIIQYI